MVPPARDGPPQPTRSVGRGEAPDHRRTGPAGRHGWPGVRGCRSCRRCVGSVTCTPWSQRPRCVGPFLKEIVKREAVSLGFLRSGSARANRLFLSVTSASRVVAVVLGSSVVSVVVAAGSCNRSFPARLLPTHSFAEYRPRLPWVAPPGRRSGQMRIYLVRIPRRKGHSIQSIVRPGVGHC